MKFNGINFFFLYENVDNLFYGSETVAIRRLIFRVIQSVEVRVCVFVRLTG